MTTSATPPTRSTSTASPTSTEVARWTPIVRVRGRSMLPTLAEGQWLLTRPARSRVAVGDIVVFAAGCGRRYVKRVAAGPGDLVELEAGRLFVNRHAQDGRSRLAGARVETWQVPAGHVFVVGDNPSQSNDSRVWVEPFVAVDRISGVAVARRRQGRDAAAFARAWQAPRAGRRLLATSGPEAKFIFGRTSLWSVLAQLQAYPHGRAGRPGCPCWRDSTEAGLPTVVRASQALDAQGKTGVVHTPAPPLATTTTLKR